MRILVTGGTGFVGRFAVRALVAAGHDVRALVRDRDRAFRALGSDVELVVGSALEPGDVRAALDGSDALLHAAAIYSYDRRDIARMSAETPALAATVLTAALEAGVERVVDVASVVVFTTRVDRVTSATPVLVPGDPTWDDAYARAKTAAETIGLELADRGLRRVVLHPSRVLGPEDSGPGTSGGSVIALLRGGATTDARGGWVDVRDVAVAVVAAFEAPIGTRAIVSAASVSYRQLAPILDGLTGLHPRRSFLPHAMVRLSARLNDLARGRVMDLPVSPALEYVLTAPPIDGSSAETLLGVRYRPLEDTLSDAIRWWASNGVIDAKLAGRLAA